MEISEQKQQELEELASESLKIMDAVASNAKAKIQNTNLLTHTPLIAKTGFSDDSAVKKLDSIQKKNIEDFEILTREPVIARVVVLNEDKEEIYFISRTNPSPLSDVNAIFASYRSPIGRLASVPPGEEIELNIAGKSKYFEIIERTQYHPKYSNKWDSFNNLIENNENKIITIESLLEFIKKTSISKEEVEEDILSGLLDKESEKKVIFEGIRRNVIERMSLRDQPILDKYQDEIFRLPLSTQLLIIGPPGTGKTTTLIRRLGQKLDKEFLPEEEKEILDSFENSLLHKDSWLMFTPTELLKQYVKEAFNREGIPASEDRIKTWDDHRRYLARNVLGILKSNGERGLILNDNVDIIKDSALDNPTIWYNEFSSYFHKKLMTQLKKSLDLLIENIDDAEILGFLEKIENTLGKNEKITVSTLKSIERLNTDISKNIQKYQNDIVKIIRESLNFLLNTDKEFLNKLSSFIKEIQGESDVNSLEDEDIDSDEDIDESDALSTSELTRDYNAAIRALAKSKITNKKLNSKTKNAKIIDWLGEKIISEDKLIKLGHSLNDQRNLKLFSNPISLYVNRIHTHYRDFRKECLQNNAPWYIDENKNLSSNKVNSIEVDIILLLSLKNLNSVLSIFSKNEIENNPRIKNITSIITEQYRNQILVDEATDFSPIQLACMMELSNPKIRSFFACGDFNQRITKWGAKTEEQIKWISPNFDIRSITISYRQSQQLNELAKAIANEESEKSATLPDYINSDVVKPVLSENIINVDDISNWLKNRINEIERLIKKLPSIAIFVNEEEMVQPITDSLSEKLIDNNIHVASCPEGKVVGQNDNVRVFSIEHIKGLEFEAVFFIGIDKLAEKYPSLFDKFLYVGVTRAATYLGITCEKQLPEKIESVRTLFTKNW
jgi:superfamily I DNA/RNA helicase